MFNEATWLLNNQDEGEKNQQKRKQDSNTLSGTIRIVYFLPIYICPLSYIFDWMCFQYDITPM